MIIENSPCEMIDVLVENNTFKPTKDQRNKIRKDFK